MMVGYILLALGIAVFVLSFMIPVKTEDEKAIEFSEDMIKHLVDKELESAKGQINDIVDETVSYAMEKTERSMDRITNEKMMAVNEYSDTVLSEINKNHQEVVFLYDMLNDKHENLKNTVSEVEKKASEVRQAVKDAEITALEAKEQIAEVKEEQKELLSSVNVMEETREAVPERRMTAIDRLKMASKKEEDFKPLVLEKEADEEIVEEKKTRRKRTTKPKVKEEAVVLGDDSFNELGNANFELIQSDEAVLPTKMQKNIADGPDLNLGENKVGKTGGRNNNERILELHNAGKSNVAIAKELGLGVGEVKLVIGLFEGI